LIPAVAAVAGCNVINPAEPVPTYIKIDSFHFVQHDPVEEGPIAHNITCAWIYYNNNPIGAFDLPCNVPVITEGDKGLISVWPGIALNGLVDLQPIYAFYNFDSTTLVTDPGGVREFTPVAKYLNDAKFPYKEDFEIGNSFQAFDPDATGQPVIQRTKEAQYVLSGGGGGLIELTADHPYSENISNTGFSIPQGEAYIEISYKCSVPFEIGMYNTLNTGVDAYNYIFGVKATDTWKKIYIELGSFTGTYKGKDHKVLIKTSLTSGQSSGYVALDNIKVVTF